MSPVVLVWVGLVTVLWIGITAGIWAMLSVDPERDSARVKLDE